MSNNNNNGRGNGRKQQKSVTRVITINQPAPKPKRKPQQQRANGKANTPLLPVGVNNRATVPLGPSDYLVRGEEVVKVINVAAGSPEGQIIFNDLITPQSARRLGILSQCWQRLEWMKASLNLVTLNGSTVTSGYTMGWLEDPEAPFPIDPKDMIPFLTALRSTTVRQNWVQSESGCQVTTKDKPEMYTQRGSDIRRFSPGRLIIAITGSVTTSATFQLMLKYHCRLYVPYAGSTNVVPGTPGQRGAWPTQPNVTVSTTGITYPGIGAAVNPNTQITTTAIVAVMETANPAPTAPVRLLPIGSRIRVGALTAPGSASIIDIGTGSTFFLAIGDVAAGQFRAFTPLSVTATQVSHTTLVWT